MIFANHFGFYLLPTYAFPFCYTVTRILQYFNTSCCEYISKHGEKIIFCTSSPIYRYRRRYFFINIKRIGRVYRFIALFSNGGRHKNRLNSTDSTEIYIGMASANLASFGNFNEGLRRSGNFNAGSNAYLFSQR